MEGNMVDKGQWLGFEGARSLIESFVSSKLPEFKNVYAYNSGFGHWGLVYQCGINGFELKSDRGGLEIADIFLGSSRFWVGELDKSFNLGINANEKDLLKVLNVIYLFFS